MISPPDHAQAAQRGIGATTEAEDAAIAPVGTPAALLNTPEFPSARGALAFAERHVRSEDDVPPAELHFFTELYAGISRQARQELAASGRAAASSTPSDNQKSLSQSTRDDSRTALLRSRYEACRLVLEAERHRPRRARARSWKQYALALTAILTVVGLLASQRLMEVLNLGDVSRGKAWVASSTYSPAQAQSGTLGAFSSPFFFHTASEVQPWIRVDLGSEQRVRSATIVNRKDCCGMRSVPLVLEVSGDGHAWRTVARRNEAFGVWRPSFWAGKMRYLRLRVLRESVLHLESIVFRR